MDNHEEQLLVDLANKGINLINEVATLGKMVANAEARMKEAIELYQKKLKEYRDDKTKVPIPVPLPAMEIKE